MRTLALLMLLAGSAQAGPTFLVAGGLGLPELLRLEVGGFVHPRLSLEAVVGLPILAPLGGLGVTGWLLGDDPVPGYLGHRLVLTATARLRLDDPTRLRSGGDSLGAAAEALVGYGLLSSGGFLVRVQAGALLSAEGGFAAGPQAVATAGYAF